VDLGVRYKVSLNLLLNDRNKFLPRLRSYGRAQTLTTMTLYMKDEDKKPFPTWIDERAAETPERVFALIPRTNVVKDGYQEFTYRQLTRAVDKLSWFLDQELGPPAVDFQTIAYMGVSDLRYTILYIAVQKTRRQV
jgi:hypothetical protein